MVQEANEVANQIELPPVSSGLSKTGPSVMVVVP
jgi:hypothetical protein